MSRELIAYNMNKLKEALDKDDIDAAVEPAVFLAKKLIHLTRKQKEEFAFLVLDLFEYE